MGVGKQVRPAIRNYLPSSSDSRQKFNAELRLIGLMIDKNRSGSARKC